MPYFYLFLLLLSFNSFAARESRFGVGSFVGFNVPFADNEYHRARIAKTSSNVGVGINYIPHEKWPLALNLNIIGFKGDDGSLFVKEFTTYYRTPVENKINFLTGIGVGAANFQDRPATLAAYRVNAGYELMFLFNTRLTLLMSVMQIEEASPRRDIWMLAPQAGMHWYFL